jgi:hypothetical protein
LPTKQRQTLAHVILAHIAVAAAAAASACIYDVTAAAGPADVDSMDESDEEVAAAAGGSGRQAAGQNLGLYNEIGQHNPKKAKADAKRAKRAAAKQTAAAPSDMDDDGGDEFDFDDANAADGLVGSGSEVR